MGEEKSLPLKLVAFEHSTFDSVMNPLMEQEGMKESIPLLIGSDTLIRYNAKIDMKKKAISFTIKKEMKKKKKAA